MNLILYTCWLLMLHPAVSAKNKGKARKPRFDTKYFTDVPSKGYVPIVFYYKPDRAKPNVHASSSPTSTKPRQTTKEYPITTTTSPTTTTPTDSTKKILTRDELLVDLFGPASYETYDYVEYPKLYQIKKKTKTKSDIWVALEKSEKIYKSEEVRILFNDINGYVMEGDPDGTFYYQPDDKRNTSSRKPYKNTTKYTDKILPFGEKLLKQTTVKRKLSSKKPYPSTTPWHTSKTRKTSSTRTTKKKQKIKTKSSYKATTSYTIYPIYDEGHAN